MGNLKEISSWTKVGSNVSIPAIQRGLVWKPRQVELLWDSILRGFPIGSFMLAEIEDEPGNYYLMDGQQRFNAISLGYNKPGHDSAAMLWIDVNPEKRNSSRKFWIRVTTTAHPWGFKRDDNCTTLSTSEKREALSLYKLDGSIYNDSFSLRETWPLKAVLPLPLYLFLEAPISNKEDFCEYIINTFQKSDFAYRLQIEEMDNLKEYISDFFYTFKIVNSYVVSCSRLPAGTLSSELTEHANGLSDLEVLFERINVNGTRISQEDLIYSSIKAYWPNIREINDELSSGYMQPAKLIQMAFRLAFTSDQDSQLHSPFSLKQIRDIAKDLDKRHIIIDLYENKLNRILELIDEWLGVKPVDKMSTPPILRTIIINKNPEIYLLLMYWAKMKLETPTNFMLIDKEVKAIAFMLQWFGNDIPTIVKGIHVRNVCVVSRENIGKAISRAMHDRALLHIYTPDELRHFFSIEQSPKWTPRSEKSGPWLEFFNRIMSPYYRNDQSCEILLYAEREYINSHFSKYNPARQDLWETYNRPWDFDHIVPKNSFNRRGEYHAYNQVWLHCVGNIAAISFESNRSKSDRTEYSEYYLNANSLLFDEKVCGINVVDITYKSTDSMTFAASTFNRLCNIYERSYEVIEPALACITESDTIKLRREIFNSIKGELPEICFSFVAGDNKEYPITREQDWSREWLVAGITIGDYNACFVWNARKDENGKPLDLELGIRKASGTVVSKENVTDISNIIYLEQNKYYLETENEWWYAWKYPDFDAVQIVTEIQNLVNEIQKAIKIDENSIS